THNDLNSGSASVPKLITTGALLAPCRKKPLFSTLYSLPSCLKEPNGLTIPSLISSSPGSGAGVVESSLPQDVTVKAPVATNAIVANDKNIFFIIDLYYFIVNL